MPYDVIWIDIDVKYSFLINYRALMNMNTLHGILSDILMKVLIR